MDKQWRQLFDDVDGRIQSLERAVTTSSGFPIQENLLEEALYVTPTETPILNRLEVVRGAGKAAAWKEITDFGELGAASVFYAESGSPSSATATYAEKSATYKAMGNEFGVSGMARAAGATLGDQLVKERENAIISLKLDIENAIINADGTSNSFEGLLTQIVTGNNSYVQSIGGALTLDDLGEALQDCWDDGYQIGFIVVNPAQAQDINDLVLNAGDHSITVLRDQQGMMAGLGRVTHLIDPITGVPIDVIPSRYLAAGTIIGVPEQLPAPVAGSQGRRAIWWDELLGITEMEVGIDSDVYKRYLKTYATLVFPGRRGAFKLTGIT
jgi:hypothetical protein